MGESVKRKWSVYVQVSEAFIDFGYGQCIGDRRRGISLRSRFIDDAGCGEDSHETSCAREGEERLDGADILDLLTLFCRFEALPISNSSVPVALARSAAVLGEFLVARARNHPASMAVQVTGSNWACGVMGFWLGYGNS